MCPKRIHSVAFFKSSLDNGLKTHSASMVRVTSMPRPPTSSEYVQLSGRQRPCAEFVQIDDRGIAILQVMGCC
eukprot:7973867-Pyramimonas_sp.AAC.1